MSRGFPQPEAPLLQNDGDCLGVLAKFWEPGKVKTRMAPALGNLPAAQIYQAFVTTTLTRLAQVNAGRMLAYTPANPATSAAFSALGISGWSFTPQGCGDLGQRMASFFTARFREGANRVVLVGTDSPNLPVAQVQRAFDQLQRCDVVLGPTTDGGYYLVGARQTTPPIFADIPWSTPQVCTQTIEKLTEASLGYTLLEPWYDVDEINDLQRLLQDLNLSDDPGLIRLKKRVLDILGK